ncbi:hydroxyisourate hydrolase [Paenibacillus sp. UNC451MF]|uniref:hydroxyisourate hydrolase n=1 Tax=Paenibacillus sp. UNC451MF TaxID=1449063 RepID=UPI000491B9D9|nr:hydroxyisourate hydrolase [Paenibacillus sp. UNC451MF]
MTGRITTHVLDLSSGLPAAGVQVTLFQIEEDDERVELLSRVTNLDGRLDSPLLEGETVQRGIYELVFHVSEYFCRSGGAGPVQANRRLPFLDKVPIRFGVEDDEGHYHVPLLIAPGGYSTYRGS